MREMRKLKSLRTEATTAFTCVRNDSCLSLFWTDRDAGARAAVGACIDACNADAGLPDRDAARSAVSSLASALEQCVESSCSSQCPSVNRGPGDRGFTPPPPPRFDAEAFTPPHFDAGSFPPPFFDAGRFLPPSFGDAGLYGRP
jgi:hypothetical protein